MMNTYIHEYTHMLDARAQAMRVRIVLQKRNLIRGITKKWRYIYMSKPVYAHIYARRPETTFYDVNANLFV